MHKIFRHILKRLTIALTVCLLVLLLVVLTLGTWLRSDAARQIVFQMAIEMLQEKLQTKVTADSISIELLQGQVRLYGMQVNDRDDSLLVHISELHAGIAPHDLLDHKVRVTDAELLGADARLWRDSLTNNYQFVIDAFKKKHKTTTHKAQTKKHAKWQFVVDIDKVNLQKVHAKWDVRHKPRKNTGKPYRGAFDANHVDVMLSMKAKVKQQSDGIYDISINDLNANDISSGFHVRHLEAKARVSKEKIDVNGIIIRLAHSEVGMQPFTIDLKKKRIDKPFTLTAEVLLQDIAQPFAPVLSNFTTPLLLTTKVSGQLMSLNVDDIYIHTPDNRLTLKARGVLDSLFAKKEALNLQFRDIDMKATDNMKEQIVMHFAKKMRLKMLRQMKAVGDIRFQGSLGVLYKKEVFEGKLTTRYGYVTTQFTIDGFRRYMTGYINTPSLDMGKVMNIPQLGPVKCRVDFDLNISKKTPRPATALPNGRLPMGTIKALVYDAQYSNILVPEVELDLKSDGSTATGHLWIPGQMKNMSARVSYVQTDTQQRVWVHFTRSAQQWMLQQGVRMLAERLGTDVEADSINLRLFQGDARLYGIRVKDRRKKPLFSMDSLCVSLNVHDLLRHNIHVTHLGIYGVEAHLDKDSVEANFRFLLQSSQNKSNVRKPKKSQPIIISKSKTKKKIKGKGRGKSKLPKQLQLITNIQELEIERMHVKWNDKDKPRKNHDKPSRGAFDTNHIDMWLNMRAGIQKVGNDSYTMDIKKLSIKEMESGLQLDSISAIATWNRGRLQLDNLYIYMPQSWLHTDHVAFNINKQRFIQPFTLSANVVLQDIAKPFAPMLSNFTTPLDVVATVSGGINDLHVENVSVETVDDRFALNAAGFISGLTSGKDSLKLSFHDTDLRSDNETLMQLVNHFAKKMRLKMVRQMKVLGDIHFTGDIDIMPKRQDFAGNLLTGLGNIETAFTLDGNTHFMTGYADISSLELGDFTGSKRLGNINGHIDFDFNISSKSPRPTDALPNGRLPQGTLNAAIYNVKYGIFRAKRVEAEINSDGSTATGTVIVPKRLLDIIVNFNYIQTDEQQHLKFKPKLKFHFGFRHKRKEKEHNHTKLLK